VSTCFSASLSYSFCFKIKKNKSKIKISNFGGISKFLKLIVFGQILVVWVDFFALTMAESMLEASLKS
jgi:hypothetical protein